jgi:hypothetical protein
MVDAFVTAFIAITLYGHVLLLHALLIDVRARHRDKKDGAPGRRSSQWLTARHV